MADVESSPISPNDGERSPVRLGHRTWLSHVPWAYVLITFLLPVVVWMSALGLRGDPSGLPAGVVFTTLVNTHLLAAVVGLLSILMAAPAALIVRLVSKRGYRFVTALIFVPVCVGMLARNHAWIGMLSQRNTWESLGWRALGGNSLIHTDGAVYLVMAFVFLSWAFFIAHNTLGSITIAHLESARTLGANTLSILWRILLPVWARGAFVSFFLVYCSALGYFITPRMVGSNAGALAGNIIVDFVGLGEFRVASEFAAGLLISSTPFVVVFLWLASRGKGLFSWKI